MARTAQKKTTKKEKVLFNRMETTGKLKTMEVGRTATGKECITLGFILPSDEWINRKLWLTSPGSKKVSQGFLKNLGFPETTYTQLEASVPDEPKSSVRVEFDAPYNQYKLVCGVDEYSKNAGYDKPAVHAAYPLKAMDTGAIDLEPRISEEDEIAF